MSERIVYGVGRRSMRRILTAKNSPKDYYKGTGTGPTGRHTKHGDYIIEPERVRQWVVPTNLDTFSLKPYVSKQTREQGEEPLTTSSFIRDIPASEIPGQVLERPPIRVPKMITRMTDTFIDSLQARGRK